MNVEWNVNKYTKDFSFVHQYGVGVMELLDLDNVTSVIDLGCGNGALTEVLYNKGLLVTGIDTSKELLQIARETYPTISFEYGDATNFEVNTSVDAVFHLD